IFTCKPEDSASPPIPPPRITPRKRQPITISKRPARLYQPLSHEHFQHAENGQKDTSIMDGDVSASPKPIKPLKPASCAPFAPREPPLRLAGMPRPANRQDRQADSDAEKLSDVRQKLDSSVAANGDSGVCVSRVPSFQRQKAPPKGTPANRE
ncbi:hypothetical protein CHARACLAT_030456, partial [Characodon lateralis]|nr:hypothetical protein [Characodon lateralis]